MNNKIIAGLLAIVLLILSYQAGKQTGIKQGKILGAAVTTEQGLKIGAILPLTGGYASIAEEVNRGAQLAVDEAKAKGINVDYIAEDDEFKATNMVNAGNKLLNQDKVDAVFTMAIEEIKPNASLFNQAKKPILSTWDSNDYIKGAGDYVFSTGFATEDNGRLMADFAYNKLSIKKVAVIEQIDDWSKLITAAFVKRFQELGGEVVVDEKVLVSEQDFRTIISKTQNAGAQGIYFPVNPPGGSRIITQARQLNFKGQLMSGDGLIQDEINASGSAAEGVYQTQIYADNATELQKNYKLKYGQEPSAIEFVSFGYDAINTFLEAKQIAQKSNLSFAAALKQVHLNGAGGVIDFGDKQYSERVEKIYQIKNGGIEEVKN